MRVGDGPIFPPTPPPDIDLDLWQESIDLIQSWAPRELAVTHFGRYADVDEHLDTLRERLVQWGEVARTSTEAEYGEHVRAFVQAEVADPVTRDAYEQANPPATLWAGMHRFWTKNAGGEAAAG